MAQDQILILEQQVTATNLHIKLAEELRILAQESKELARDSKKLALLSKDLTLESREMSAFMVVSRSTFASHCIIDSVNPIPELCEPSCPGCRLLLHARHCDTICAADHDLIFNHDCCSYCLWCRHDNCPSAYLAWFEVSGKVGHLPRFPKAMDAADAVVEDTL